MMSADELRSVSDLRQHLHQAGYLVVPVKTRQKAPFGFAWQTVARKGTVPPTSAAAMNTGILCDGLRAIDIDIDDVDIAGEVARLAVELLGRAPARVRDNSGRQTLVYRAEQGEPKKRILNGRAGKIEVLGHGQQFVAFGLHPSGAEFQWPWGSLEQTSRNDLPSVSEDEIDQFLAAAVPIIGADDPAPPPRLATPPRAPTGATSELEDLLAYIDAGCTYHDWVQVLMGIHHETGGSAEGLSIADRWSARGNNYAGTKAVEAKWRSFKAGGGVTIGTIALLAEQGGADLAAIALRHGREHYEEIPPETLREWQNVSDRLWQSFQRKAGIVERIEVPDGFDPETGEVLDAENPISTDQRDIDDAALHPPGLVGDLADWICDWTAEPIRIHAVGAALVVIGTLLGRKVYSRVRPTCTALYIGAIAPSGMGKQHPQDAIRLALSEVTGGPMNYAGWAVSLPKLVTDLHTNASKVMIADEFADKLVGLRSRNASTSQAAISEGLRSLWGTNTGTYSPDASISRGDAQIMRPNFSFYGASTIKDFTKSLVSKDVTNGLLNRFLILPRYAEIAHNHEPTGIMTLPPSLKERLSWLNQCLPAMDLTLAARGDGYPKNPILVPMSDEATAINEANKVLQREKERASEQDDVLALWGRFAEQVKRVAMIVACGRIPADLNQVRIERSDIEWATNLVTYSIEQFIGMVRRDMVESAHQGFYKLILGIIRTHGKEMSRMQLGRKIDGRVPKRLTDEIIASLIENGEVVERRESPASPKGGRPTQYLKYASRRTQ